MSIAHKIIWILTKVSYTSDPNFVILAWMGEKLSHRQARDCRTHTQTQATTIPGPGATNAILG